MVIVWSKYTSEVDSFREALYRERGDFRGRLIFALMEKPLNASAITARALSRQFSDLLEPLLPLKLLWAWESLAQRAAINTSTELALLAAERLRSQNPSTSEIEGQSLLVALREVSAALIEAEAGMTASPKTAPLDFLHALGAIRDDRLENSPDILLISNAGKLLGRERVRLAESETAAMNSLLVVGTAETHGHLLKPGTIYEISTTKGVSAKLGFTIDEIHREFCKKSVSEDAVSFARWKSDAMVILIELSPACDYSQKGRCVARLIAGVLVPDSHRKNAKLEGQSRKQGATFSLARFNYVNRSTGTALPMLMQLSSRFIVTLPLRTPPRFMRPIARLREPALTDVRNWCAAQTSRVGYLFV